MSLKKLAELAGVSDVTVMRALRGEKYVRPELREKILQLAREHRYEPNLLAKGILQGKTQTIGIVLPDIAALHHSACVASAIEVLSGSGYRALVLTSGHDPKREFEEIRQAAMRRVDGLLMIACREAAEAGHFDEIQKRKIPLVLMSRAMQSVPFDIFTGADEEDGYDLTARLLSLGHTRIAHITPDSKALANEWIRTKGWRKAMTEAGIKAEDLEIQPDSESINQSIYEKTLKLLDSPNPPTAIFANYPDTTVPTMKAIQEMNLALPKDISLATFLPGNPNAVNSILPPRVGGFWGPSQAIGQQAAKRLIELIDSKEQMSPNPRVTKLKGTWFEGDTIGACPTL